MQLCDRQNKMQWELEEMTASEFNEWCAYVQMIGASDGQSDS